MPLQDRPSTRTRTVPLLLLILALLTTAALPASGASPGLAGTRTGAGFVPPWEWPLSPKPEVSRKFEPPPKPWSSGHRGVDLRAAPAQQVLSPADGTVSFVGWVVDRPVITIDHGSGLRSSFEPVSSTLTVGETVREGQSVGTLSTEAHCPFACVHWGVRLHGEYVDPLAYVMDKRPSILLPVPG
jgi:murein DD-endopeptidase MepM/ murein hydrolase activator NlpD